MNPIQQHFVQWILHSTHVIPVTARCAEAYPEFITLSVWGGLFSWWNSAECGPSVNAEWHGQMQQGITTLSDTSASINGCEGTAAFEDILVQFGHGWLKNRDWVCMLWQKQNTENDNPYAPNFCPSCSIALM